MRDKFRLLIPYGNKGFLWFHDFINANIFDLTLCEIRSALFVLLILLRTNNCTQEGTVQGNSKYTMRSMCYPRARV